MLVAVFALTIVIHPNDAAARCGGQEVHSAQSYAKRVWSPDRWRRGAPKHRAIVGYRHRLECASSDDTRKEMKKDWRRAKAKFYAERHRCRSGPVTEGRVSVFGGGLTAGGYQASEPGIAMRSYATLGRMFVVTTGGHTAYLRHIDWGPASWTGRSIDITFAGANKLGGVTTDAWGSARLVPGGCL